MKMEGFMEKLFPDKKMLSLLKALEKRLCYRFRDISLLVTALTHRSFVNENPLHALADNERFEFLGDAVLGLSVADFIISKYPDLSEGALSKIRAAMVNENALADIAHDIKIGECLLLGRGEENSGGRNKASLLANTLEAVFAAIYLDSNFEKAHNIITLFYVPFLKDNELLYKYFDYKTALYELCRNRHNITPVYDTRESSGPQHDMTYKTILTLTGKFTKTGFGKTKKDAEKMAAQKAWEVLHNDKSK
jgi:ribonuclease III